MENFEKELKIGIKGDGKLEKDTIKDADKILDRENQEEQEESKVMEKEELKRLNEELENDYERIELEKIEELENCSNKLKGILEFIDKNTFPEDHSPVKIVPEIKSKYEGEIPSAQHCFEENEKGEMVNEHYQVNEEINKKDYDQNDAIGASVHEVRHRAQHTLPIELFTRENFKKFEEKYPVLKLLKESLPENLSPNDFDACIIEDLSSFLRKNKVTLSEISAKIISKGAEEIFENIEYLARKKEFTIPTLKELNFLKNS
ncbi:hypothetical protein KAW43_00265 [Candidatus Parcubacteria bacterium]|nr:hypothetical protein [Candidatus Parcubacteria bacterium]